MWKGPINGHVQPSCWIKDRQQFFDYQNQLTAEGVITSEIGGFLARGLVSFHCFDPDDNRLNFSSL